MPRLLAPLFPQSIIHYPIRLNLLLIFAVAINPLSDHFFIYIMLETCPDIAQAVINMSQFSSNPSKEHLQKALYIVQYLVGTKNLCIKYDGTSKAGFMAYSDTDWAGDHETCRSTSGYAIFLGDGIVSWLSRRQHKITLSSTEAEYSNSINCCNV